MEIGTFISNKLKTLRAANNLTQRQISEALNMKPLAYQRYELGTRQPSFSVLVEICELFKVTLCEFFKDFE